MELLLGQTTEKVTLTFTNIFLSYISGGVTAYIKKPEVDVTLPLPLFSFAE